MVLPSLRDYSDAPDWNQVISLQLLFSSAFSISFPTSFLQQEIRSPPEEVSARGGSMTDRARKAKIPLPEAGLKCPRCESTNTKFCYFNNYSFSQPRHFCKTCRRYWTRGGALRNVPIGGGCRRNKRSKSASSFKSSCSHSAISSDIPPDESFSFFPSLHSAPAYYAMNSAAILDQWSFQQVHHFPLVQGLEAQDNANVETLTKGDEDGRELAEKIYYPGISKNEAFWGDGGGAGDISCFNSAFAGDILW